MSEDPKSQRDIPDLILPYELKYFVTQMYYLAQTNWTASTGERISVVAKTGPTETRHGWEIQFESADGNHVGFASVEADERPGGNTKVFFLDGELRGFSHPKAVVGAPFAELRDTIRRVALQWGEEEVYKLKDQSSSGVGDETLQLLLDRKHMRQYLKYYNPETAKEIIDAFPKAWYRHVDEGGRWGPGMFDRWVFFSSTTIGRYLSAFKKAGFTKIGGIDIP